MLSLASRRGRDRQLAAANSYMNAEPAAGKNSLTLILLQNGKNRA